MSKFWYLQCFASEKFVLCRLINKSVLEWFPPIICKEETLSRSTNPFSRKRSILCFWLRREGQQIPNTEQLLYWTDKSSHQKGSIKKAVLKNFAIFTGKHFCWNFFHKVAGLQAFIKKRPQHTCFPIANTCFEEHQQTAAFGLTLGSDCFELCFWTVAFKTILTQ